MKQVIFSKYSNDRSAAFQIRTDILKDENGVLSVTKSAMTDAAKAHIDNNEICFGLLTDSFAGTQFVACPCKRMDERTLLFDFLTGKQMDALLDEALEKHDMDTFWKYLSDYKMQMNALARADFEKTAEFTEVFGDCEIPADAKALPVANVDQIFQNIKIEDGNWFVYDYEWTFRFPVPVGYIFYRAALFYGQFDRKSDLERKGIDLFSFFDISENEMVVYQRMEESLQSYILSGYTRLWEMYEIIKPDNYDTIAVVAEEKKRRYIRMVTVRRNYFDKSATQEEIKAMMKEDGHSVLEIPVSADIETLNMTLGKDTGMVRFYNVSLRDANDRVIVADKAFLCNGNMIRPDVYQFADDLPNLYFNELPDDGILHIEYKMEFGNKDLLDMAEKQLHESEQKMQEEIAALRDVIRKIQEENEGLKAQSEQYLKDYNTVINSAAWKSTKPLRKVADMMKGKSE